MELSKNTKRIAIIVLAVVVIAVVYYFYNRNKTANADALKKGKPAEEAQKNKPGVSKYEIPKKAAEEKTVKPKQAEM